jgi:hypothetical protein
MAWQLSSACSVVLKGGPRLNASGSELSVPEAQWTFRIGRTSRVDRATKLPRQCDEPFDRSFDHVVGAQQKRVENCQPNALALPSRTKIVWLDNLERQRICDGLHTSKKRA